MGSLEKKVISAGCDLEATAAEQTSWSGGPGMSTQTSPQVCIHYSNWIRDLTPLEPIL